MLAIEIDGSSHNDKIDYDRYRQQRIEKLGVRFMRFRDIDIKTNLDGCIKHIRRWIDENKY